MTYQVEDALQVEEGKKQREVGDRGCWPSCLQAEVHNNESLDTEIRCVYMLRENSTCKSWLI